MGPRLTRKLAAGAVGLAALGGAAGTYAATQSGGGSQRQAFVDDAAKRLNVTPERLRSALTGAFEDRLDAAVKAGRLTQQQADAIKRRIERNGGLPPFGAPGLRWAHRAGAAGLLRAASSYLGLDPAELRAKLRSGKSLAQIAQDQGKPVAGLEQAIERAAKTRLDTAVKNGRLTSAQEQRLLSRLHQRIDDLVHRTGPPREVFRFRGRRHGALPLGAGVQPAPGALPGGPPPGGPQY